MSQADIITVRPEVSVDTLQKLPNFIGISEQTAGAKGISMNMVVIPAGGQAEPHFHEGYETAIYMLQGSVRTRYGENLSQEVINHAGDFIFIPANVPHQPINLSQTENAVAIVARNDANEQETVRPYPVKRES
ncbi:cupin domain-containing protein [Corallincola platygyrae]|uniref:Cupin domain-containing protein n=1 Tax=Corallincola platygyrae TaxID=1193278 RepID=A0ABW4XVH8_9GAMM